MKLQELISTIQRSLPENLPRRVSSDVRLVRELLLSTYQSIMNKHPWSFLHSWENDQLPPPYTTGTVDVVQGSASVTGTGTAWASSHVGWYFLTGESVPIKVVAVPSPTTLTLERAWGEASKTGLVYKLAPISRPVPPGTPDVASVVGVWSKDGRLVEKSILYLDSLDPKRTGGGTPWAFSSRGFDASGPKYEIYPYPASGAMYRLLVLKKPTLPRLMTDEVVFNNPSVLELGVRAALYEYAYADSGDEKFLNMSVALGRQFATALAELIEEDRVATSWLHSVPDVEPRTPTRQDPWRHDTLPW